MTNEIFKILSLAIIYFIAAKAGLLLAIPPGYATAVWPPTGIVLVAVLIFVLVLVDGILRLDWVGRLGSVGSGGSAGSGELGRSAGSAGSDGLSGIGISEFAWQIHLSYGLHLQHELKLPLTIQHQLPKVFVSNS